MNLKEVKLSRGLGENNIILLTDFNSIFIVIRNNVPTVLENELKLIEYCLENKMKIIGDKNKKNILRNIENKI